MEILNSIALFIILITIIVFVHEYGHYYLARKYGVPANTRLGLVSGALDVSERDVEFFGEFGDLEP